ncbi:hypothetical protein QQS21_005695 [Conoideocrella luteorostrata]|uniref:Enterotoxin n=1 Tax=Conoideocrella luteorostrata TaxID=1105319 RepID=A0AAJ0CP74_9HYPO|nr:hypothetical protein QQS21_005695 [Conoideocrella luteorostrata]
MDDSKAAGNLCVSLTFMAFIAGKKGQYVYRGDGRSPRQIRESGGFQPQGDHWEEDEQAFNIDRHYHAGPRICHEEGFRTAYVSMAEERETAEVYGTWLYEIRATPNILSDNLAKSEVVALGGAHWTQIRRWTRIRDTDDNRVDESAWVTNPEYGTKKFENPEHARFYRVSTEFPEGLRDGIPPDLSSDSEPGSDSEDSDQENNRRPRRRLYAAVDRWMDQTAGVFETYGGFPPEFKQNTTPRDDVPGSPKPSTSSAGHDVPGPSRPSTSSPANSDSDSEEESDVVRSLFHFLHQSAETQNQIFPNNPQIVSAARNQLDEGACPAWTSRHGSKDPNGSKRPNGSEDPDSSEGPSSSKRPNNSKNSKRFGLAIRDNGKGNIDGCCKVYKRLMKALPKSRRKSNSNDKNKGNSKSKDNDKDKDNSKAGSNDNKDGKSNAKGQQKAPKPASVVFVGDYLWPEEVKKQGGFLPRVTTPPGGEYEIEGSNNGKEGEKVEIGWQTYLVPAFMTFGSAAHHAAESASKNTAGCSGVVYAIHATPNIVNLGNSAAAVAGIRWSQVLGWMQVPENYSPPEDNQEEHYDHEFDKYQTTVNVPQDIRNVNDLEEFMKENGKAVHWTSELPLLEGKAISGEASKLAKSNKKVAAPHESSVWESIKTYATSHPVALALLPAVLALNFIPGVGEAADAAELAALGTESVEAIELEEAGASTLSGVGKGLTEILKGVAKLKVD